MNHLSRQLLFVIVLLTTQLFAQNPIKINGADTIFNSTREGKIILSIKKKSGKQIIETFYNAFTIPIKEDYYEDSLLKKRIVYFENGKINELSEYKQGLIVHQKKWNPSGNLELEQHFKIILQEKTNKLKSVREGKYIQYNSIGKLKQIGKYKNDLKEGTWKEYWDDGILKSTSHYSKGQYSGKVISYTLSGKVRSKNEYLDRETYIKRNHLENEKNIGNKLYLDGEQLVYSDNGILNQRSNYKNGKLDGIQEKWYSNGIKESERYYSENLELGTYKKWTVNGDLSDIETYIITEKDGKKTSVKHGIEAHYYPNGKPEEIKSYVHGVLDGKYYKHEHSLIYEYNYKNGVLCGKYLILNSDSTVKLSTNYICVLEKNTWKSYKDGEEIQTYSKPNSPTEKAKKIFTYRMGKVDGKYEYWNDKGIKIEEQFLRNQLEYGKSKKWYDDGQLKFEANYIIDTILKCSLPIGELKEYYSNGKIKKLKFHNRDHLCYKELTYYEDGVTKSILYNFNSTFKLNDDFRLQKRLFFYPNGTLEREVFTLNDRVIGTETFYFPNGTLKKINEYDYQHHLLKTANWLFDGTLLTHEFYSIENDGSEKSIQNKKLAAKLYENTKNKPMDIELTSKIDSNEKIISSWLSKDQKFSSFTLKDNFPTGKLYLFFQNGRKLLETNLEEGNIEGAITIWNENGDSTLTENYKRLKRHGIKIQYNLDGKKQTEELYDSTITNMPISRKHWYPNGQLGSIFHYDLKGNYDKDCFTWYENGQLHTANHYRKGNKEGRNEEYYENGQLKYLEEYSNALKDGVFKTWNTKNVLKEQITYSKGKRNGYTEYRNYEDSLRITGYYKNDEKDSIWNTYNTKEELVDTKKYKLGVIDQHIDSIPCVCYDPTIIKLNYAPQITELADLAYIRRMGLDFHAPIGDFYSSLFYINKQFSMNVKGDSRFMDFDVVSFKEMYLQIPDNQGIKLIFNPCIYTNDLKSKFHINMTYNPENKLETKVSVSSKNFALEFNPNLLHTWDPVKNQASFVANTTKHIGSKVFFNASTLNYEHVNGISFNNLTNTCFSISEIAKTGVLISFDTMVVDFNPTFDSFVIQQLFPSRYFSVNELKKDAQGKGFMGVYVPKASLTLPFIFLKNEKKEAYNVEAENILISNQFIFGTYSLPIQKQSEFSYLISIDSKQTTITKDQLIQEMKSRGFDAVNVTLSTDSKSVIIQFYLKK